MLKLRSKIAKSIIATLAFGMLSVVQGTTPAQAVTTPPAGASVTTTPFACTSTFYQVSSTGSGALYASSISNTGVLTFTKLPSTTIVSSMNAIGYNTADNYIYGVVADKLYKIDSTGAENLVGSITGALPGSPGSGDFIAPNKLLVYGAAGKTTFFLIDVTTLASTAVPYVAASGSVAPVSGAWDFTAKGNYAFGMAAAGTSLIRMDLTTVLANGAMSIPTTSYATGAATTAVAPNTNTAPTSGSGYGAAYSDLAGNTYFFNNGDAKAFQVPVSTLGASPAPKTILMGGKAASPTLAGPNDGASCPKAASAYAPITTTTGVTGASLTGATLNGTINPQTAGTTVVTTAKFCWSTSSTVDSNGNLVDTSHCVSATPASISAGATAVSISLALTGLSAGTTYYYQAYGINSSGESYGEVKSFTTDFTLNYDANGATAGSVPAQQIGTTGVVVSTNSGTLLKDGSTFLGWATTVGNATAHTVDYAPNSTINLTSNTTLYAVWSAAASYSLTYDANTGSGTAPTAQTGPADVNLQSNPFTGPSGATVFLGWNTKADGTGITYSPGELFTISANTILYAKWGTVSYTLTYNAGASPATGTVPASQIGLGQLVVQAPVLGAPGLVNGSLKFAGWVESGTSTVYMPDNLFDLQSNKTLVAKWVTATGTLHYNSNHATNGVTPLTTTPAAGSAPLAPNEGGLVRLGYTFAGWGSTATSSETLTAVTISADTTTEVYAVWTPNQYTVTYDKNIVASVSGIPSPGHSAFADPNFTLDTSVPATDGKTFVGWMHYGSDLTWDEYQYASSYSSGLSNPVTNSSVIGTAPAGATLCQSGHMPNINFNIGSAATGLPGCPNADYFLNHFTGYIKIPNHGVTTESVTFAVQADDGFVMQFTNNGTTTTPLNSWTAQSISPNIMNATSTVTLTDGAEYGVDIWHQELTGDAGAILYWKFGNGAYEVIPASAFSHKSAIGVSYSPGDAFLVTEDSTLFAKWVNTAFSLAYNKTTGTGTEPVTVNGNGLTILSAPTGLTAPAGKFFAGWNTKADGTGTTYSVGDAYDLTTNTILYAKWATSIYTLTYDANGSTTGYSPSSIHGSGDVVVSDNLYGLQIGNTMEFAGWNTEADGLGFTYLPGALIRLTQDRTLYAQYSKVLYTLTFDKNQPGVGSVTISGTVPDSETGTGTVVLPGNVGDLAATGFNMTGWWNTKADGTGVTYSPGDTFILESNQTLYAKWIPVSQTLYTLTFDGNGNTGGTIPDPTRGFGIIVLPSNTGVLTKTGFIFGGWNGWSTEPNGGGITYFPGDYYDLRADQTLYAVWDSEIFTLSFESLASLASGSVPNSHEGYGDVAMPGNIGGMVEGSSTPLKFAGWKVHGTTGPIYAEGDVFPLETNTVMTAVWVSTLYRVTYDGNGNTGGFAPDSYSTSGDVNLAFNEYGLVKNGFYFNGWTESGTANTFEEGDTYTVSADVTFKAKWVAVVNAIYYDGNFNDGGTTPGTHTGGDLVGVDTGYGNFTILGNTGALTLNGFVFSGWNEADDGSSTSYSVGQVVNLTDHSIYLYAVWRAPSTPSAPTYYTVQYNGGGSTSGSTPGTNTVVAGGSVNLPGNTGGLVRPGYNFVGWTLAGSTTPLPANYVPTGNVVLYALWSPIAPAPTPTPATPTPKPTPSTPAKTVTPVPGVIKTVSSVKAVAPNHIVPVTNFIELEAPATVTEVTVDGHKVETKISANGLISLSTLVGPKDVVKVTEVIDGQVKEVVVKTSNDQISLANVNFSTDSYSLDASAKAILDKVATVVKAHGFTAIQLVGHTDSAGAATGYDNQTLSHNRAIASMKYLQAKLGKGKVRITIDAKAHVDPVAVNSTAAGRAANRRVEIVVH